MNDHVVKVENLGKCFKIYSNPWARALEWVSYGQKAYHRDFWALRDISFELKQGECLGIIGPNGAGKTTLLKILTRSLYPTAGEFQVQGNVLSLLELGTGFHGELTGRQNIYRSTQLLGFPEGYVSERIQDIEEFSELGDFFDRAIKTYSSGMYIRLAFSMFVFLKPEVLVVDEALSVGDVFFQQKCFAKIRELLSSDTTCLFASHDMAAIQNLCHRAILLIHGQMEFKGDPEEAVSRYYAKLGKRSDPAKNIQSCHRFDPASDEGLMAPEEILTHNIAGNNRRRHGAGGLVIVGARVTDSRGRDTLQISMQEKLCFHVLLRARDKIVKPNVGIDLFDRLGNLVFASGAINVGHPLQDLSKDDQMVVRIDLTMNVQPGEYSFCLAAAEPSADPCPNVGYVHDRHEMLGPILVTYDSSRLLPFYGIAKLPMEVQDCVVKKE